MDTITYHYKYVKTPKIYIWTFIKMTIVLAILTMVTYYFPSTKDTASLPTLIIISLLVLIAVGIYLYNKKYVNYVILDYKNKTIEVFYIEPFKECSMKTTFDNFSFSYDTVSYDILIKVRQWQVLTLTVDYTNFKISEWEMSFPLETMNEMADKFERISSH